MRIVERIDLEAKLIAHLEAAQAITDGLGLDQTGYLVERALDDARAIHWPRAAWPRNRRAPTSRWASPVRHSA